MRFLVLALLSGCVLLHHGGTECADDLAPAQEFRDPQSGICTPFGVGTCPCGAVCAIAATPDWAACFSSCEALDEASCKISGGCRAVYTDTGSQRIYKDCWGTAPEDPAQGGDCTLLDAQDCSRHEDCSAVYIDTPSADHTFVTTSFDQCIPEMFPTP